MRINTIITIIIFALILSCTGLILSIVLPDNQTTDAIMMTSIFVAASSGVIASVFNNNIMKSKQWKSVAAGGLMILAGFLLQALEVGFIHEIVKVSGFVISILVLGYNIYNHQNSYKKGTWIWFLPFILAGMLFKIMQWPGANIIIFGTIATIFIISIVHLVRFRKQSKVRRFLLIWQIVMCISIATFYFRYIKMNSLEVGFVFIWLSLLELLLREE